MDRIGAAVVISTLVLACSGCKGSRPATAPPRAPAAQAPAPPAAKAAATVATAPAAVTAATAATAEVAPCSGPGYATGPALKPIHGQAPFTVTFNCLWPTKTRLEIALARTDTAPLARNATASLLRAVWAQLHARLGKRFPRTVQLCLFRAGTKGWANDPLGCMKQGYEPEAEEGEEDEVELHVAGPVDSAQWVATLSKTYGRALPRAHRPRLAFDDTRRELEVTYPYTDAPGAKVSFTDALVPFFAVAYRFYPPVTDLQALTFVGTWKGKPVVRVHVADEQTFLRMDPWPMRERFAQAKVPYEPGARRTPEQAAMIGRAYRAALARLPPGSVTIDASAVAAAP